MGGNQNLGQDLSLSAVFMCEDATERAEGNEAYEHSAKERCFCASQLFFGAKKIALSFFFGPLFFCPHLSPFAPICPHLSPWPMGRWAFRGAGAGGAG